MTEGNVPAASFVKETDRQTDRQRLGDRDRQWKRVASVRGGERRNREKLGQRDRQTDRGIQCMCMRMNCLSPKDEGGEMLLHKTKIAKRWTPCIRTLCAQLFSLTWQSMLNICGFEAVGYIFVNHR